MAKTPQQFKADMRRAMRGFKGAATTSRRIGYNVDALRIMRNIAAKNNAKSFATDGASMGNPWKGLKAGNATLDDAVDTGKLKRNMTGPYLLKARVAAHAIYLSVPKRRVPYIRNVASRVYGWNKKSVDDLAAQITSELARIARGEA